ncbi:MAG: acyl carrier protein [Acidobacteriota bacterium]|nr:acyl carrier protein [Acidobacteriota bacterium]MDE3262722.1 acyl carrier protein [Acidobacteriota bacterium]
MATTNDRVLSHFLRFLNEERMSARGKQIVEDARGCSLADFGISSVEAMELVKDIGADFGVEISAEEVASWNSLGDMTNYLDAHS